MNFEVFADRSRKHSVVFFVQENDLGAYEADLKALGDHPNVNLVVQPCPYEGIEFLCRAPIELPRQVQSLERDVFWHALSPANALDEKRFAEFCSHHYDFMVAILEQNAKRVERERKALVSILEDR